MSSLNQKKTAKAAYGGMQAACRAIARFSGVSLIKRGGLPPRGRLTLALMATLALLSCDFFDIFPPEIEIVSPIDNASCVGTLSCDIDATDNRSIAKVELFLDDVSIHEFTDAPYKADLDISGQSTGTKTFKAIAYDQAGNHAEDQHQVSIVKESVSTPTTPTGPSSGNVNTTYNYSTGGSTSSIGHNIQYRFDWGGGNYSAWSSSTSASHAWSSAGTYSVKAQVRCATHTSVESSWSSSKAVNITSETVSTPTTPTGPSNGNTGTSYSYSTGDASSSLGHSIQYRFDWGDGSYSNWSSSTSTSHSWSSTGTKNVKAQVRCASHTSVVSSWSSAKSVTISGETVSTPSTPTGPSSGNVGTSYSYSTGGASSSLGHSLQYCFDWGDGNSSSWSSSTSVSHSWSSAGTYSVKAQARCATHTGVVSSWSSSMSVTISGETISTPSTPTGPGTGSTGTSYSYATGGASSSLGHNIEYRFDWGDGNISTWSSSTTASHSWISTGTYSVRAQARCATHISVESSWSEAEVIVISAPSLTITSPKGEETWREWSTQTITWESTGDIGDYVGLQYSIDDGATWIQITISTPNDGSYSWVLPTVPDTMSTCRVRVAGISTSYSDFSDENFIISNWAPILISVQDTPGSAYDTYVQNNYVYVADGSAGLQIIDIASISNPAIIGSFATGGNVDEVIVSGTYAHILGGNPDYQIVSISNPNSPTLVGSYGETPGGEYGISLSGNNAYIADGDGGLIRLNISDPANPTLVNVYNTPTFPYHVEVISLIAYVASFTSGLEILNLGAGGTVSGSYDTPDRAVDLYVLDPYAYVADGWGGLQIIDFSNLSNPTLSGFYDTPDFAHEVHVVGNHAFVADGSGGLQVIDVSEKSNPVLAGSYNTPGDARGIYVVGNTVFVAGTGIGLLIFDVSGLP